MKLKLCLKRAQLVFTASTWTFPLVFSKVHSISPIPYIPIARTKKPIPRWNSTMSKKIRRGFPLMISKPTAAKTSPNKIEKIVFGMSSPPSPMNVAKASIISANSSCEPNFKARTANGGANIVNKIIEIVPPINDAIAAAMSA